MPILRINQNPGRAEGFYRIDVGVEEIPGLQSQRVGVEIEFALSPQDREDIRWYLEDYLQFHQDPAPRIAKRVEERMAAIGDALFRAIFQGSDDARDLWAALRPHLADTRIEVTTGIAEATAIPWELIRDPRTGTPLVLSAVAFVRGQPGAVAALAPREREAAEVRILLVICRPKAGEDVPFRSVAGRLVTRLNEAARETLDLDVLRPPTFERLAEVLRLAKEQGRPYHVVHFDGHGVYADPETLANAGETVNTLQFKTGSTGRRGFVMFENPESKTNAEFVDGFKLGRLLTDNGVPLLVLNACQSAFAGGARRAGADDVRRARRDRGLRLAGAGGDGWRRGGGRRHALCGLCGDGGAVRGRTLRRPRPRPGARRGRGIGPQEPGRQAGTANRLRGPAAARLVGAGGVGAGAAQAVAGEDRRGADQGRPWTRPRRRGRARSMRRCPRGPTSGSTAGTRRCAPSTAPSIAIRSCFCTRMPAAARRRRRRSLPGGMR